MHTGPGLQNFLANARWDKAALVKSKLRDNFEKVEQKDFEKSFLFFL